MATMNDTDALLDRAGDDELARNELLRRYRSRLRQLVALRMDRRLSGRVDPSDVVQESLAEADRRLAHYLASRPLPFYPWLRKLTLDRLIELYRHHVGAACRSVLREDPAPPLPDNSLCELAGRLVAPGPTPSAAARKSELREQVHRLLALLSEKDREVLVLRHLEQLTVAEVSAVLGVSESAVKVRHVRALDRLRRMLGPELEGELL